MAFDRFCLTGFDQVTFDDLSEAAGVSRSTFLRYFGTKEDVVLFVFDPLGDVLVDAIKTGEATQDEWSALRRALIAAGSFLRREVADLPTILSLIERTPALCARLREKQTEWRPRIVAELTRINGTPPEPPIVTTVRVAAALESLWIILGEWAANGAGDDLNDLMDAALGALSPTARG